MKTQLKRRVSQATLLAFMLTTAFGAVGASAADDAASETKPSAEITQSKPIMVKSVAASRIGSGLLMQPAHERNYLKLLVGAYAPDSLDAWKQALEDRKQAESELPKPSFKIRTATPATKADGAALAPVNPAETKTFTLQAAPVVLPDGETPKLLPLGEARMITISKDGKVDSVPSIQALPVEAGVVSGDIMKATRIDMANPAELPESFKRQQKLAEAVEADDTATIVSLLPELLEDYKKETENIRSLAKTLKEQAAKAEERK